MRRFVYLRHTFGIGLVQESVVGLIPDERPHACNNITVQNDTIELLELLEGTS